MLFHPLFVGLLLYREVILAYSADGAYPIFRDVFKGCAWGDAAIRIANFWVIHVTTGFANVLFHKLNCFV
jgi:hypothetical protein